MFSSDLALKIQEANECATQYQEEKNSMNDREMIMGALSHLLAVPKQRNEIMIRLKLMESKLTAQMMMLKGYRESIRFVLHVYTIYGDMFLKIKNSHNTVVFCYFSQH